MADAEKTTTPRPSLQVSPEPQRSSFGDSVEKKDRGSPNGVVQNVLLHSDESNDDDNDDVQHQRPGRVGTFALAATALLILAWWISSIVLPITRHRWLVQTLWAWFFVLVIAFRFVPASVISRPISSVWKPTVRAPVYRLPYRARLALAWLGVIGITFGSAFGFERPDGTVITDRVISLAGVFFCQLIIVAHSLDRTKIDWMRMPLSIIMQQALALFVLKSDAGFKIFGWFNTAVADFQFGAVEATALIFDPEVTEKGWFFVTGLAVILFFAAWVQMLYWFGWMQWFTKQFAWFGARVLGASGAETFVAIWTPWFGQVNSALLVGPYIQSMTDSEIFALMATSMASISSLMIRTYTKLGATPRSLIAQSAILIPGAIVNAKIAFPEPDRETVVTRSRASTHGYRKKINLVKAHDILEALCDGAWLGLRVAGGVLTNFFMLLALLVFINGSSIWIFRGFSVKSLDLHQVAAAPLTPFTFFLGVPRREVWGLSYLIAQRLLNGTDFAFAALAKTMAGPLPYSSRGFAVVQFALANTASLPSLGTQLGAMTALAPGRKHIIAKGVLPALIIATLSSYQAAAIAASVL